MTPHERRQRLQAILDQHDQIAKELRESGEAFRASADYVREASAAMLALTARMTDMSAAIHNATTAMIAANHAALALFNDEEVK